MLPIRSVSKKAAEAGDAVGQHHAVDAELDIGVVVADMEQPLEAESCETPGACKITRSTGALVPCGSAWIVSLLIVSEVVPIGSVEIAPRGVEARLLFGKLFSGRNRWHRRRSGRRRGADDLARRGF